MIFQTATVVLLISVSILIASPVLSEESPYPPSPVITGITWDFSNLVRLAPGSDLWPITWANDNNLYTSWGDGGGFDGSNLDGRVSLGFARLEGSPVLPKAYNVWGGKNAENPATFQGKATGMLAVNGTIYTWLNLQDSSEVTMKLHWSTDQCKTWQTVDWRFGTNDTLRDISFLNFGKGYDGARDGFIYCYALERGGISDPSGLFFTDIQLLKVPIDHTSIINRSVYEFFAGFDAQGQPIWTPIITERKAVFTDSNGVGIPGVSYSPGLQRYLMTIAHGPHKDGIRKLGVFDAPEPWGPWATVQYNEDWGEYSGYWLAYYIPTKMPEWMSADGRTIHLVFSGDSEFDSFNVIKGSFDFQTVTDSPAPTIPATLSGRATSDS